MKNRFDYSPHIHGRQLIGSMFAVVAALLLSACGVSPDNGAATVIKKGLKSPSSYSQSSSKEVWSGKAPDGNKAYVVRVEYDAQNGFGAMIRDCQYVAFRVKGDEVMWQRNTAMAPCNLLPSENKVVEWQVKVNFES